MNFLDQTNTLVWNDIIGLLLFATKPCPLDNMYIHNTYSMCNVIYMKMHILDF